MFTGIIETLGKVVAVEKIDANRQFTIASAISKELRPEQSVSHNGVCLTVVHTEGITHTVVAVKETLAKTNLGTLTAGSPVNLERAMPAHGRFDGHIVQGHVDQCGICVLITDEGGSKKCWFSYDVSNRFLIVEKGSICIDGVSLTVVDVEQDKFSVALIPYTLEHTRFHALKKGDAVNLEFDILGKYVRKNLHALSR